MNIAKKKKERMTKHYPSVTKEVHSPWLKRVVYKQEHRDIKAEQGLSRA